MTATKADQAVESAAEKLDEFVRHARGDGGAKAKLENYHERDPEILRKLKPRQIAARLRGGNPKVEPRAGDMSSPSHDGRPAPPKPKSSGPNAILVIGAAFAVGILVAKVIDWRSHAHPRA